MATSPKSFGGVMGGPLRDIGRILFFPPRGLHHGKEAWLAPELVRVQLTPQMTGSFCGPLEKPCDRGSKPSLGQREIWSSAEAFLYRDGFTLGSRPRKMAHLIGRLGVSKRET